MSVRLLQPYMGQAANTLFWGAQQGDLVANGIADTQIERASDYGARIVTSATATIFRTATVYRMNSASAQTLTMPATGYWPINTVITIVQEGAGATTIAPAAGVTIDKAAASLVTKGQWNVAQLVKIGANAWVAVGGIG